MKHAIVTALAFLIWTTATYSEERGETLEDFSSDLAELYNLSGITKRQLADMNPKAQVYAVHRLMKQAKQFQAKWHHSDLVEINRFQISGGDQLVLDVEFRFK